MTAKPSMPAGDLIDAFLSLRRVSAEEIIFGRSMVRSLARVRHELMWLLRDLTHMSLAQIGEAIGGRDATTVQHGVDQVCDRIAADDDYRREIVWLRTRVITARSVMTPELCLRAVESILVNPALTHEQARTLAAELIEGRNG